MSGSEREHLSNFLQFGEILRHSTACISAPWLHIGRLGETPLEPKYEETQATAKKLSIVQNWETTTDSYWTQIPRHSLLQERKPLTSSATLTHSCRFEKSMFPISPLSCLINSPPLGANVTDQQSITASHLWSLSVVARTFVSKRRLNSHSLKFSYTLNYWLKSQTKLIPGSSCIGANCGYEGPQGTDGLASPPLLLSYADFRL